MLGVCDRLRQGRPARRPRYRVRFHPAGSTSDGWLPEGRIALRKLTCWIVAILLAILPFSVAWG